MRGRVPVLGAGAGLGAVVLVLGAVSWLCAWCRRWCCELAVRVHMVETGRRCWVLVARVVETGCRVLGAGAGRRELARRCSCWRPLVTVK